MIKLKIGHFRTKSLLSQHFWLFPGSSLVFHTESRPKLLELTLFPCVAVSLSVSSSQVPFLRTSIPGLLLFFLNAFMVSWEIYRDACEAKACEAKDHKLKYHIRRVKTYMRLSMSTTDWLSSLALLHAWYIDLARAKSEAPINKFIIQIKQ